MVEVAEKLELEEVFYKGCVFQLDKKWCCALRVVNGDVCFLEKEMDSREQAREKLVSLSKKKFNIELDNIVEEE